MSTDAPVRPEDVFPVRSRVSWGPIFAGAMAALAVYFLLTLLGSAIGLTIGDDVRSGTLATGAAIWAILVTAVALFLGGWIVSQLTVGETKAEAVVYGVILWGVVFAMLLWLLASGVRAGFNAMVGVASAGRVVAQNITEEEWQDAAKRAGVPQERINEWRQQAKDLPADARKAVEDPENRRAVAETATKASWWAFGGTLVSMIAAVAGAVLGAGPTLRLIPLASASRVTVREASVPIR